MSDDERGGTAAHAVTQVADLLVRARILPVNELQTIRVPREEDGVSASVVAVLRQLLPERIVRHDIAEVTDEASYVRLVQSLASATADAWHPEGLRSTLDPMDDEAMVEFQQDDQHVLWRFYQPTEGIAPDFGRLVKSFTVATLGAAFVPLPAEDGHPLAIYLPEPAATELSEMLAELAFGTSADIAMQTTSPLAPQKPTE
jgi:hypothetical protein